MFNLRPYSPTSQDFMWVGEYSNGEVITEFDLSTGVKNSFYSIEKDRLIRFGLVGHGMRLYYEIFGGVMKLNGQSILISYRDGDKIFPLAGGGISFKDIITYKDAESVAKVSPKRLGRFVNRVVQYNFGYKQKINIEGVNFSLKVICSVPFNSPSFLTVWLVSDKEMDGELIIKNTNTLKTYGIAFPLGNGVGGRAEWVVR